MVMSLCLFSLLRVHQEDLACSQFIAPFTDVEWLLSGNQSCMNSKLHCG